MTKPLTRLYADTRRERAQREPEFGRLIFLRAVKYLSKGDLVMGMGVLHNYIDATIGFDDLGKALGKKPESLKRALENGNDPGGVDLREVIRYLRKVEGVRFKVSCKPAKPARKPTTKSTGEMATA